MAHDRRVRVYYGLDTTYNTASERRAALVGATPAGRLLFVVFTRRFGLIRVVTTRDATAMERRRYRTRGK